jgi:hypothetical protein
VEPANQQPTCFISYAWEGKRHQAWVAKLATALFANGIRVRVDFWEAYLGMDLSEFMEVAIRDSSHVLVVCTPKYAQRANRRMGGVGWETAIVTGEMFNGSLHKGKFVPVLRFGHIDEAIPSYLKGKLYVDFRARAFRRPLERLLRHLYNQPSHPRPLLGTPPPFANIVVPRTPKAVAASPDETKSSPTVAELERLLRKKEQQIQNLMSRQPADSSERTVNAAGETSAEILRIRDMLKRSGGSHGV